MPVGGIARAQMIASVLLVLMVELINSALEAAVDRIGLEDHRLAKRAKDIGSAAVFVALANVGAVWASVLLWA
jgi:diacylglycerol kinase (ATP)